MTVTRALSRPWVIPVVVSVLAVGFLLLTGVGPVTSIAAIIVITVQGWGGAFAWHRLTRGRADILELAGMGLAIGTAASVVSGLAVRTLGLGSWGWALPAVAALAAWVRTRATSRPARQSRRSPHRLAPGALAGLGVGAALGLMSLVVNIANYPLRWSGLWDRYHPDMLFFESLSTSLARYGPLDSVFLSGGQVRYHWLVYAWSGQVSEATAAGPFVVLTRVLPLTATVMVVLIAVSWSARLSRVPWVPTLAVLLVTLGGYVGATYGTILNFDSPSQAVSTAWLLAMCVVFLRALRPTGRTARLSAGLILLSFAASGGKVSSGAVGVAAMGFVWLVGTARRTEWRHRALLGTASAGTGLVAAYLLIVAGSADPGGLAIGKLLDRASSVQGLNPLNSSVGIVAGTVILAIAIGVRWAGAAWLVASPASRWSPLSLLGGGLALTGTATVLLVSGGLNDTWFALAASAPLSVISAVGAGRAASAVGASAPSRWLTRPLIWAVAAGLATSGLVTALWLTGGSGGNVWVSSLRWLGPPTALVVGALTGLVISRHRGLSGSSRGRWLAMTVLVLVVAAAPARLLGLAAASFGVQSDTGLSDGSFTPRQPFVDGIDTVRETGWSSSEAAAGAQLEETAAPDDIVLTNITFSPLVPALAGLRTWVSGAQYQAPYGRPAQLPALVERERQSWDFIDAPTDEAAQALCSAGVRWVWVDPERTERRSWSPWATVVYSAADVQLLNLDGCS